MSESSSAGVGDSLWFAGDFQLAASTVILQPSSGKVVIVHDTEKKTWFLPRGRKDVGESLEQCALREAYEESGYRAEFLPLCLPSLAPTPQGTPRPLTNTEPIYITTHFCEPIRRSETGREYLAFYYVGQIPADAVREEKTGMSDEQAYVGMLVTEQEACARLSDPWEGHIVGKAFWYWRATVKIMQKVREEEEEEKKRKQEQLENERQLASVTDARRASRGFFNIFR
ncbi:hypothetical protein BV25DRAFT_1813410 [Artomyces pyxidatus]|uniref:Uncharacterized protein n=1 Tax=Artomyces pyxidatus TaxID=48021 RepID=A0ACB8SL51_9AGAM|nr:hypothetical protein BV25DRAFT_1813410 [Artomyces pyxidatus]